APSTAVEGPGHGAGLRSPGSRLIPVSLLLERSPFPRGFPLESWRQRNANNAILPASRNWRHLGVGMQRVPWYRNICWPIASFIIGAHIAAAVGTYFYVTLHGFSLSAIILGVVFLFVTPFGISGGYHRLFAHAT